MHRCGAFGGPTGAAAACRFPTPRSHGRLRPLSCSGLGALQEAPLTPCGARTVPPTLRAGLAIGQLSTESIARQGAASAPRQL